MTFFVTKLGIHREQKVPPTITFTAPIHGIKLLKAELYACNKENYLRPRDGLFYGSVPN